MRRLFPLLTVVFLFVAVDASAHCMRCNWSPEGCATCADTDNAGGILCTITHNGYGCTLDGGCEGTGACGGHCVENLAQIQQPVQPKLRGEWQLVRVELTRTQPVTKEKKTRA